MSPIAEKVGTCRLCVRERVLVNGHVVPAFVAQWLRRSAPGKSFFVDSENPEKIVQDLHRIFMMCSECDNGVIGTNETAFAPRYRRYIDGGKELMSDDVLMRLAVGLSWRVVIHEGMKKDVGLEVGTAAEEWRQFLKGERSDPGVGSHHVFLTSKFFGIDRPRLLAVLLADRSESTVWWDVWNTKDGGVAVVTHLPGLIFVSMINPVRRRGWMGTEIVGNGEKLSWNQAILDYPFVRKVCAQSFNNYVELNEAKKNQKVRRVVLLQFAGISSAHHFENLAMMSSNLFAGRPIWRPDDSVSVLTKDAGPGTKYSWWGIVITHFRWRAEGNFWTTVFMKLNAAGLDGVWMFTLRGLREFANNQTVAIEIEVGLPFASVVAMMQVDPESGVQTPMVGRGILAASASTMAQWVRASDGDRTLRLPLTPARQGEDDVPETIAPRAPSGHDPNRHGGVAPHSRPPT